MPKVRQIQQRFTIGALDPKMKARVDIEQYYAGAETLHNVLPIPQGGFRRRDGLTFVDKILKKITLLTTLTVTVANGGTGQYGYDDNETTEVLTTTNISTTNPYVVVQYDLLAAKNIGLVRLKGAALTAGTSSEFYIQVSSDASSWTTKGTAISLSTTEKDFTRRVHGSYRYVRFARIGSTDLTTSKVSLEEMNVWEEGDESESRLLEFQFSVSQTYIFAFTDQNIAIYKNGVYQIDIENRDFTSAKLVDLNFAPAEADTMILVQEDIQPKKLVRSGSDDVWVLSNITFDYIPKFNFTPAESQPAQTLTPSAIEGSITLTAGGGSVFSAGSVGQYVEGNGGRARITAYTSVTVVKAIVETPFYDTTAMASGSWDYQTGYEDVWSSTKGWPRSVCFHEGRMAIGGAKNKPRTIWGSKVGLPYNFDPGTALDDEGFDKDLPETDAIVNIRSGRSLQVFTYGGEHIFVQSLGDPITPTTLNTKKQTSLGSKAGMQPQDLEGSAYFIQRGGKSLAQFAFDDTQQAYAVDYPSLFWSHLLDNPVDLALRKAVSTSDASYLYMVNEDGTLAIANILRSQNITSGVSADTTGTFKNVAVDVEDAYFIVKRNIGSDNRRYLEKFDPDAIFDASVMYSGSLTTTLTGLSHLEGNTVKVRADDSNLDDEVVASGQITASRDPVSTAEVGLDFTVTVKDLPVEVKEIGTVSGIKKNLSEVVIECFETQSLAINGKEVSFRQFGTSGAGNSPLDQAPPIFSGTKRLFGFMGWDYYGQVTLTQPSPGKFTILSITKKINT